MLGLSPAVYSALEALARKHPPGENIERLLMEIWHLIARTVFKDGENIDKYHVAPWLRPEVKPMTDEEADQANAEVARQFMFPR